MPCSQADSSVGFSCSSASAGAFSSGSSTERTRKRPGEGSRFSSNLNLRASFLARKLSSANSFSLGLIVGQSDSQCPVLPHPKQGSAFAALAWPVVGACEVVFAGYGIPGGSITFLPLSIGFLSGASLLVKDGCGV